MKTRKIDIQRISEIDNNIWQTIGRIYTEGSNEPNNDVLIELNQQLAAMITALNGHPASDEWTATFIIIAFKVITHLRNATPTDAIHNYIKLTSLLTQHIKSPNSNTDCINFLTYGIEILLKFNKLE